MMSNEILNVAKIDSMLAEIENMSDDEHEHIRGIVLNSNTKFTENTNGSFVRINQLDFETIKQLFDYVEKYRQNQTASESALQNLVKNKQKPVETTKPEAADGLFQTGTCLETTKWKTDVIDSLRKKKRR